jgi:hypothetical protein
VNYQCAGTVEFLMDMETGAFYFIEVNPRVQVEHTVTEEVTGIDIVRAQILITEGKSLTEATGTPSQYDVKLDGHAIQCRITTEDPANNFIPDYGRITAYRGATGMGIRLDGGTAYSGAVITRYYDSLLEKVTAWAPTPEAAIARMDRALREFRIRGVSTNIAFVENLLKHPTFLNYQYHTKFIDETPELFDFKPRRDRATRILTYIADITVNGHPETAGPARTPRRHQGPEAPRAPGRGARDGHPPASGRTRARSGGEMDEGADAPSDHRHDHARRAPVASGDPHALARHDQGRARLCREPAGALFRGMLGRRDLRRGLSLPAGMPVAAAARHPRGDAQHHDPDAPAGGQRRGLHHLSRQRGAEIRAYCRRKRGRCLPRLRQSQLGGEHARLDGRGAGDRQDLRRHDLLHRQYPRPRPGEVRPQVLRRHGQGAGGRGRPCAGAEGHGGPPETRRRRRADPRAQGRGGPADPLPHP